MSLQEEFPPCGGKEIEDRQRFMAELMCVVLISTLSWAIFRFITKNSIGSVNSVAFNITYILLAPVVFLGPVMYYWVKHREETGLPVRLFVHDSPKATFNEQMVKYLLMVCLYLKVKTT